MILPRFERDIAPFEVRDASGSAYRFPFLGGFNVPRPHVSMIPRR